MARILNKDSIQLIKQWEGLRLTAYPDPGSRDGTPWTIGYGHTKNVKKGQKITEAQAEQFLIEDLQTAITAVESTIKVPLTDNKFGALVSLVHNIGVTAFKKSTLVKKLNAGDYSSVPAQLLRWVNNDGKKMQGLVNRRNAEIGLWVKGEFVSSNTVVATPQKPPVVTKESVTWATTILSTLGLSFVGTGPIQIVLAGIIAIGFIVGLTFFILDRIKK